MQAPSTRGANPSMAQGGAVPCPAWAVAWRAVWHWLCPTLCHWPPCSCTQRAISPSVMCDLIPLCAVTDKWFSQRVAPRARNPTGYFTVNALRLLRKFVSKNKIRLKIFQSKTMSTLILICLILGQSENKRLFFSSFWNELFQHCN